MYVHATICLIHNYNATDKGEISIFFCIFVYRKEKHNEYGRAIQDGGGESAEHRRFGL